MSHAVMFEIRSANYNTFDSRCIRATFPNYPFSPQIGGDLSIPFKRKDESSPQGKIFAVKYPAWLYPPNIPLVMHCFVEVSPDDFNEFDRFLKTLTQEARKRDGWTHWTTHV